MYVSKQSRLRPSDKLSLASAVDDKDEQLEKEVESDADIVDKEDKETDPMPLPEPISRPASNTIEQEDDGPSFPDTDEPKMFDQTAPNECVGGDCLRSLTPSNSVAKKRRPRRQDVQMDLA